MQYALIIFDTKPEGGTLSSEAEEAILERHRALQQEALERGELTATARLDDRNHARTVRDRDGRIEVADGPYLETKEWLVGFYLVDCEDEAAALRRAKQICPAHGAIEVRPVRWQRVP